MARGTGQQIVSVVVYNEYRPMGRFGQRTVRDRRVPQSEQLRRASIIPRETLECGFPVRFGSIVVKTITSLVPNLAERNSVRLRQSGFIRRDLKSALAHPCIPTRRLVITIALARVSMGPRTSRNLSCNAWAPLADPSSSAGRTCSA